MPVKKKTNKKSRTSKKPVNKKPQVAKAAVTESVKPVEPAAKPIVAKNRVRGEVWATIVAVVIVALFVGLSAMVNRSDEPGTDQSTSNGSPSQLRVEGQQSGVGSNQSSDVLQPQPTGLQQAQPAAQSNSGSQLQAPNTPNQTTIN